VLVEAGLFEGVAAGGALVPVDVLPKRVIKSARLKLITPELPVGTAFPDASVAFPEASCVVVGGRTVVVVGVVVPGVVLVPGVVVVVPDVPKVGMVPEYPPHILPNCELILSVLRR
jgi:hypothetical protein